MVSRNVFARLAPPVLAAIGLAAGACPAPAAAETRAVVVGIDAYFIKPLKGARADAEDIAAALRRRGIADVTRLLDQEASRDAVLGAIDAMIARTRKDDLVIISFAGHGVREAWGKSHPAGTATGEPHETFILGGFSPPDTRGKVDRSRPGSARERIWGTEMNSRLAALQARGARTIFVADTCHSGGLTRRPLLAADPSDLPQRLFSPYAFAEGEDPLAPLAGTLPKPVDTDTALADLTFLAAVDKTQASPEVLIPKGTGRPRGALSYAFARVIDGQAPTARPGLVSRGDLVDFIDATVRPLTDNRQDPDLRPRRDFDRVVIDIGRDLQAAAPSAPEKPDAAPPAPLPQVRVFPLAGAPPAAAEDGTVRIVAAPSRGEADLLWDSNERKVFTPGGDLVASDIAARNLIGVAAREEAVRRVTALALKQPRLIRLDGGDRRYVAGDRIVINASPGASAAPKAQYYVLFNIAGTGLVQFLYPYLDKNDAPRMEGPRPFEAIGVAPPYGTDTLILVVADHPIEPLVRAVRALDGKIAPMAAIDAVERAFTPDVRIGVQPLFTYSTSQ